MKTRFFLIPAGLMLLLAACLPDLPAARMQVNVDLEPALASATPFSWTIEGIPDNESSLVTYEGECPAGCGSFGQIVRKGEWTLRVTPPDIYASFAAEQWVGTGDAPADEVTADFVSGFSADVSEGELDLTASFRRPHQLTFDRIDTAPGEPAAITLDNVLAAGSDFSLAGLTATCRVEGISRDLVFVMEGDPAALGTSTPQSIDLVFVRGEGTHPDFERTPSCNYTAHDSSGRPAIAGLN